MISNKCSEALNHSMETLIILYKVCHIHDTQTQPQS